MLALSSSRGLGPWDKSTSGALLINKRVLPPLFRSFNMEIFRQRRSSREMNEASLWPPMSDDPKSVRLKTRVQVFKFIANNKIGYT